MKIGLDISGGDFAPDVNIDGAILAYHELPKGAQLVFIGDESIIKDKLKSRGYAQDFFSVVHAPDVITFHDHPTRAIPKKPNSSIAIGFDLLAKGDLSVFASTGNTGAMLVGSMYKLNTIPGIIRPCITSALPAVNGKKNNLIGCRLKC